MFLNISVFSIKKLQIILVFYIKCVKIINKNVFETNILQTAFVIFYYFRILQVRATNNQSSSVVIERLFLL